MVSSEHDNDNAITFISQRNTHLFFIPLAIRFILFMSGLDYCCFIKRNRFTYKKRATIFEIRNCRPSQHHPTSSAIMNGDRLLSLGVERNLNGGLFENGKEYSTFKKVEVEEEYWRLRVRGDGKAPS